MPSLLYLTSFTFVTTWRCVPLGFSCHLCDNMEVCPSWLLLSLVNVLQTSLQFGASSGQSKQKVA